MSIKKLIETWSRNDSAPLADEQFHLRLSIYEAAKIEALCEMFPGRDRDHLLSDIVSAALDELQESIAYVAGDKVVAEDEQGDPVYEDVGLSRKWRDLTDKHLERLREDDGQ